MPLRTRLFLIFGATAVFSAVLCFGLFWLLGNGDESARHASTQFATAVVKQDPKLAPKGADDYVTGIPAWFGPVSHARVIDARNTSHGHGNAAHTYYVADVLLQTAHGPSVVELEFGTPSLTYSSETVTGAYELAPAEVPDDALSDAELTALAKAFKGRGGAPASTIDLSHRPPAPVVPASTIAVDEELSPAQIAQLKASHRQLDCVEKAHGDVDALMQCATS